MSNCTVLGAPGSDLALHAAQPARDLARAVNAGHVWLVVAYDPVSAYLGEPNRHIVIRNLQGEKVVSRTSCPVLVVR